MGLQETQEVQLARLTTNLTDLVDNLDSYLKKNKKRQLAYELSVPIESRPTNINSKCHYIRTKYGTDRIMCVHVEDPWNNPLHRSSINNYSTKSKNKHKNKNKNKHKHKDKDKNNEKLNKNETKNRLADKPIHKKIINGKVMAPWGSKWLPVCDGSGFPYVEGCYTDSTNWTGTPKQCIIENPATSNLANGSLYTCGFLW